MHIWCLELIIICFSVGHLTHALEGYFYWCKLHRGTWSFNAFWVFSQLWTIRKGGNSFDWCTVAPSWNGMVELKVFNYFLSEIMWTFMLIHTHKYSPRYLYSKISVQIAFMSRNGAFAVGGGRPSLNLGTNELWWSEIISVVSVTEPLILGLVVVGLGSDKGNLIKQFLHLS